MYPLKLQIIKPKIQKTVVILGMIIATENPKINVNIELNMKSNLSFYIVTKELI